MKLVIYGLTITSAWGNGHATTYRSLAKALARRCHTIRFIERDVEWYRSNRDLPNPSFCTVRLYDDWTKEEALLIAESADADAIIVGSYFPDAIAAARALLAVDHGPLFFYDIDTPITVAQLRAHGRCEYLEASLIPHYDAYLSFTGGPTLRELERSFGSRRALPFYCSVDADIYKPARARAKYTCDLSYLGTYARDRQPNLLSLLNGAARQMPERAFLIAGAMYPEDCAFSPNVSRITHVSPADHPAFYSSSRFTLNLTRKEMVAAGWSPSVRLFEASACGAVILTDQWEGLEHFLEPGEEIFLPRDAGEVASILRDMSDAERARVGGRARERILAEHTSEHRAAQFEAIVSGLSTRRSVSVQKVPQTSAEASPASLP